RDIGLWNPATRQCRLLPKPLSYGNLRAHNNFVGFGLDIQNKDYKVLLVTSFRQDGWNQNYPLDCVRKVQIYSLSSNSWRWLDGGNHFPTHCPNRDKGLYLNGKYFMIGLDYFYPKSSYKTERVILSFDFNEEIFRKSLVPAGGDNGIHLSPQLYSVGDKLACTKSKCTRDGMFFEVWALNDYNTKEEYCWTKLYSLGPLSLCYPFGPFAFTRNVEFGFIISLYGVIKIYNITTGEIEDPTSCLINTEAEILNENGTFGDGCNVHVYKESLVSNN
ncbi:hypothetical protein MKX03_006004, partial [Papaver bracteatum]